ASAVNNFLPSGEKGPGLTENGLKGDSSRLCPPSFRTSFPVATSRNSTSVPLGMGGNARNLPSGGMVKKEPSRWRTCFPVATSQKRIVWSILPDTSVLLSGVKARQ